MPCIRPRSRPRPIWWYTDIQSEADKSVYFAEAKWDVDIIVHKTDIQSDAGWVNSSKMGFCDVREGPHVQTA